MAIRWRVTVQNGPKAVKVGQCYRMERRWRPRSGVNEVDLAPSPGMLGDGSDSFFGLCGGVAGPADRGGRVEELAAQVVQQAQPGAGGVHAAPSSAGAVQDGPDEVEAARLAREAADDLDPSAG